jgi:hypothetical protein
MAIEIIGAGKSISIPTPALYLSIIGSTGNFEIYSPKIGLLAGRIGRQFVLDGVAELEFKNSSANEIEVDYEIANIRIFGSGSGSVDIGNTPSIQRIIDPIDFEATVTFDTGTVAQLAGQVMNTPPHITVPAGQAAQIVAARASVGRQVDLQVISAEITELYLCADNTASNAKGVLCAGNFDFAGSATIKTESAIWAFNDSATDAKVAVMEQYRS